MSFHGGLSNMILEAQEVAPGSGNANVNGAGVDMQGWDGVAFYISIGVITGAGAYTAYTQTALSGDSAFASPTNVTDTVTGVQSILATGLTAPNTIDILEVWRPNGRYCRCNLWINTNTVAYSVQSLRYRRSGLLPPRATATTRIITRAN